MILKEEYKKNKENIQLQIKFLNAISQCNEIEMKEILENYDDLSKNYSNINKGRISKNFVKNGIQIIINQIKDKTINSNISQKFLEIFVHGNKKSLHNSLNEFKILYEIIIQINETENQELLQFKQFYSNFYENICEYISHTPSNTELLFEAIDELYAKLTK